LDTVSDELGKRGEAPSFGDLFDEPDSPVGAEPAAPAPAPAAPAAAPVAAAAATAVHDAADSGAADDDGTDEADAPQEPVQPEAPADRTSVDAIPATAALDEPDADPDDDVNAAEPEFVAPLVDPEIVAAESSLDAGPALAGAAAAAAVSAKPAPQVQTGRLFRSAGAEGPATLDAIPAIDPEYMSAKEAQRQAEAKAAPKEKAPRTQGAPGGGLTWSGVAVVVVLGTVLVAFADAVINNSLGILTGIALLVTSVYCALLVRPADIWAAVIMPPLGFLAAALTAGQLTLDSAGSLVVREGYMLLKTLAQGAPWIIGTTAVCLVIVLVRRRRTASHA
jgi:hypothetical protein